MALLTNYLYRGLDWNTGIHSNGQSMSVRDLLKEVYEKSCTEKKWALVRHSAGMLGKQVEDLSKSVADLLVRQKQITVGMPPQYEQVGLRGKVKRSLTVTLVSTCRPSSGHCQPRNSGKLLTRPTGATSARLC